ncbi:MULTISPECIES: hypothetical protein [unclassified Nocardiopsis]|uniref:hypothetical protein n=1 Tax=unclassified Nocardiopsis TaxID=2649073 RepID=UPI00093B8621|nr:hypothetical protein [Nocardiopsis sp. TSRI0078]
MKDRLSHFGFAVLVSCSVLFAAYAPFQWSGIVGYAVAAAALIIWAYYAGGKYQEHRAKKRMAMNSSHSS